MNKKDKTLEEQLYFIGLAFLILGVIAFLVYRALLCLDIALPKCILWSVLGLYCPGCGGTRAVEALFSGQLLQSLWYHPLVLYTVVLFGGFMLSHTLEKLQLPRVKGWKFHNWYLFGALAVVAVNWIGKNILLIGFDIRL